MVVINAEIFKQLADVFALRVPHSPEEYSYHLILSLLLQVVQLLHSSQLDQLVVTLGKGRNDLIFLLIINRMNFISSH